MTKDRYAVVFVFCSSIAVIIIGLSGYIGYYFCQQQHKCPTLHPTNIALSVTSSPCSSTCFNEDSERVNRMKELKKSLDSLLSHLKHSKTLRVYGNRPGVPLDEIFSDIKWKESNKLFIGQNYRGRSMKALTVLKTIFVPISRTGEKIQQEVGKIVLAIDSTVQKGECLWDSLELPPQESVTSFAQEKLEKWQAIVKANQQLRTNVCYQYFLIVRAAIGIIGEYRKYLGENLELEESM